MRLWVEPPVIDEIAALPGNIRQRMLRDIRDLVHAPRPPSSRMLDIPDDLRVDGVEARRLRIEHWRVIYVIDQEMRKIFTGFNHALKQSNGLNRRGGFGYCFSTVYPSSSNHCIRCPLLVSLVRYAAPA